MIHVRSTVTFSILVCALAVLSVRNAAAEGMHTWDSAHPLQNIDVTMVYFLPNDRTPLPDWKERLDYYSQRIEQFHAREFAGQSHLKVTIQSEPFVSRRSTNELREGDGDAIFFRTLREVDQALEIGRDESDHFPILLVLSDINWRPLDDFYRVHPSDDGWEFEGNLNAGRHHPGATSGGARATYLSREGKGWGLVSADGWRVPYCGSDCVIYHEGVGHTIGLPHPQPGDNSVMSLGQYAGWISESWVDKEQKLRLGWDPEKAGEIPTDDLYSQFRALPSPEVPQPGEPVVLKLDWPQDAQVKSLRVRVQTDLWGPWLEIPISGELGEQPEQVALGTFDRPTPISYRVDAETEDGQTAELWGYLQVRATPDQGPLPIAQPLETPYVEPEDVETP